MGRGNPPLPNGFNAGNALQALQGLLQPRPDHSGIAIAALILHFVAFILLLITAIVITAMVLRYKRGRHAGTRSAALTELETLYARGDVTREEFLTRRADLTYQAQPPATSA